MAYGTDQSHKLRMLDGGNGSVSSRLTVQLEYFDHTYFDHCTWTTYSHTPQKYRSANHYYIIYINFK